MPDCSPSVGRTDITDANDLCYKTVAVRAYCTCALVRCRGAGAAWSKAGYVRDCTVLSKVLSDDFESVIQLKLVGFSEYWF